MEITINKKDYEKYDKLELFLKQSKNPIIVNGKIQKLVSNKEEFYIITDIEQFKTYAKNIEAFHFKSKLSENISQINNEVSEYLDL